MNRIVMILLKNFFRLPFVMWKLCRYARHPQRYTEEERWAYIQHVLGLALKSSNVDLQVTGTGNLPREGGFMLYGNHQGMFDVVALANACPLPLAIVYKKELRSVPILKQIYAMTGSFAMDREDVRQSLTVINAVTGEVQKGRRYIIFPEGTRSRKGNQMNPFHAGSFRCATKSKCTVVPMAFVNSFAAFDQKGCHPMTVRLSFLDPITYEEYRDMKPAQLADMVQDRIRAAIDAEVNR